MKRKSSNIQEVAAGSLRITGNVVKGDGTAVAGANIFMLGQNEPIGRSEPNGSFVVDLGAVTFAALGKTHLDESGVAFDTDFQLYFEEGAGDKQFVGRSGLLRLSDRGVKSIGTIAILPPVSVTGAIRQIGSAGGAIPIANAKISVDRALAISDSEGFFTIKGISAGRARLYAFGDSTAMTTTTIVVKNGETTTLEFPIQLYPTNSIDGVLIPVEQFGGMIPILPGQPNRREFRMMGTTHARYVRYGVDKTKLETVDQWLPISDQLSVEFPHEGSNEIFYQFTDGNQKAITKLNSAVVNANPFGDSTGIIIGDGTGVAPSRKVLVKIDVPISATEMRLSENLPDLATNSTVPFVMAQKEFPYAFSLQRSDEPIESSMVDTQLRTLYCQFKTASGAVSVVFKASARIVPFPATLTNSGVFTIGDGSGKNAGVKVPLKITIPQRAVEVRIWEEDRVTQTLSGGGTIVTGDRPMIQKTFFPVEAKVEFLFQTAGNKTVFVQFRDEDGVLSSVFRQNVTISPVKNVDNGFFINGGAPVVFTRELELSLEVPDGVVAFRVSEDSVTIANLGFIFIPISKSLRFLTGGTGLRTIYVQYSDAPGNFSKLYTASVFVDPFFNDPGNFLINQGAFVTTIPMVALDFQLPAAAVAMEISRAGQATPLALPTCGFDGTAAVPSRFDAVSRHVELPLTIPGPNVICVRFRNLAGDLSAFIFQKIIYDPFPINLGNVMIVKDVYNAVHARNGALRITIPPRARQMRVASTLGALASASYREPTPSLNWYFVKQGAAGDDRYFEVFVQFITETGDVSTIYSDFAILDLFPVESLTATLTAGTTSGSVTELLIALAPPLAAYTIKIAETVAALATATPIPVAASMPFSVSSAAGVKTLFMKYQAMDNTESLVFSAKTTLP